MRNRLVSLAVSALTIASHPAQANEAGASSSWSIRAGPSWARFDTGASISLVGMHVAGGDVRIDDKRFLMGELNYAFDAHWTARLAIAKPPRVAVRTAGSLQSLAPPLSGTLGEITLAPAALTLTYSPGAFGAAHPYFGAGVQYLTILNTHDRDIVRLQAENAWGRVLQAGVDIELDKRWSLFFDVRKISAQTEATGIVPALGNMAVKADITLNPAIVNIGVGYRF